MLSLPLTTPMLELLVFSFCALTIPDPTHVNTVCNPYTTEYWQCYQRFREGTIQYHNDCNTCAKGSGGCTLAYCAPYTIEKPCKELYPPMKPLDHLQEPLLHKLLNERSTIEQCAWHYLVARAIRGSLMTISVYDECVIPVLNRFTQETV